MRSKVSVLRVCVKVQVVSHFPEKVSLGSTHSNESDIPGKPPKASFEVSPRAPDVRPPDLERNRSILSVEEEIQRSMAEDDGGLEDRDVGGDRGGQGSK